MPAREKWWDDVIKSDLANYYQSPAKAIDDDGTDEVPSGSKGRFIWGDRVRILDTNGDAKRVSGRGKEYWINTRHLGGEPLLEVYIIDVGQGDGVLVVTPEGHNIMVDGGNTRSYQNSGKNAADFVDWKFYKDYLSFDQRDNEVKIQLDAMIATHNDIDHFGGLMDLINLDDPKNKAELDCSQVSVESVYHAGLSWWFKRWDGNSAIRTLGPIENGHYTKLIDDRQSALQAIQNLANPDTDTLNGAWGRFIKAVTELKTNNGDPTEVLRLSNKTHDFLPGFELNGDKCSIRVLGPIETETSNKPSLKRFPDGDSKNTNGHSVLVRLDYGDRRILLTGDLNTHSQNHIMETYSAGNGFIDEFKSDVAKGCHHGSHDVSYKFLKGLNPLCTVISSGDAESHDHPRPNIVSASAITGRFLEENDRLVSPLVYMTEVARSVKISNISSMKEYSESQPEFHSEDRATKVHDTEEEKSKYRLFLGSSQSSPLHRPRLDKVKAVKGLRYGLINVRTDGKRLYFAQMEESGKDWAIATLSEEQINRAE